MPNNKKISSSRGSASAPTKKTVNTSRASAAAANKGKGSAGGPRKPKSPYN